MNGTCVTLNGLEIQLAMGPQPLRLRNHNFGLAQRIMVKRLATSHHDPLGITDACKNQSVVVSVQYGPFNTYIPIRSTTIGKSRVSKDPIAMHTSWRSNSDIASVTSIGYPRMRASGESSTTKHRLLHASGSHPIPPPNDPNDSDSSSSSSSSSDSEQDEVHCFMADQTDDDEVFDFSNVEFTRDDLVIALYDMVKEYRKLSHSFEEAKAENMSLKSSSIDSNSDEFEDIDILKTELSKLQAENEMLNNETSELKDEIEALNQLVGSWNHSSRVLHKLNE
ncbi:hypothetical protein F511_24359 [Dorcoceras hygrometricum]|uniref:Uncharacterized protein n=1 Tax=Dorcoceras hygrometricum TaxID=472368 RepID=A0A2Z7A3G9_9LAMI|nr:hypothetical protein F511_24359 [Dorcoceras hygrometricum]